MDEIKTILQMNKKERKKNHVRFLVNYFKKIKVFADMIESNDTFENLVSNIGTQTVARKENLFFEGDPGEFYYIILKGSVEVMKAVNIPLPVNDIDFLNDKGLAGVHLLSPKMDESHRAARSPDTLTDQLQNEIAQLIVGQKSDRTSRSQIKEGTGFISPK